MSTSLLFNLSFDLGGISLILFVVWFFVNFNNSEAAFKWFSLSILALLASVIILSYGSTKLSRTRSSLPSQNETEIMNLKQEVSNLKRKHHSQTPANQKSTKNKKTHHKSKSSTVKLPHRIDNQHDNDLVKAAVTKHEHRIHLIAKVTNPEGTIMVRGVHSYQVYKIKGHHNPLNANEFVVVKGTATGVDGNVINVTATSVKKQANS